MHIIIINILNFKQLIMTHKWYGHKNHSARSYCHVQNLSKLSKTLWMVNLTSFIKWINLWLIISMAQILH